MVDKKEVPAEVTLPTLSIHPQQGAEFGLTPQRQESSGTIVDDFGIPIYRERNSKGILLDDFGIPIQDKVKPLSSIMDLNLSAHVLLNPEGNQDLIENSSTHPLVTEAILKTKTPELSRALDVRAFRFQEQRQEVLLNPKIGLEETKKFLEQQGVINKTLQKLKIDIQEEKNAGKESTLAFALRALSLGFEVPITTIASMTQYLGEAGLSDEEIDVERRFKENPVFHPKHSFLGLLYNNIVDLNDIQLHSESPSFAKTYAALFSGTVGSLHADVVPFAKTITNLIPKKVALGHPDFYATLAAAGVFVTGLSLINFFGKAISKFPLNKINLTNDRADLFGAANLAKLFHLATWKELILKTSQQDLRSTIEYNLSNIKTSNKLFAEGSLDLIPSSWWKKQILSPSTFLRNNPKKLLANAGIASEKATTQLRLFQKASERIQKLIPRHRRDYFNFVGLSLHGAEKKVTTVELMKVYGLTWKETGAYLLQRTLMDKVWKLFNEGEVVRLTLGGVKKYKGILVKDVTGKRKVQSKEIPKELAKLFPKNTPLIALKPLDSTVPEASWEVIPKKLLESTQIYKDLLQDRVIPRKVLEETELLPLKFTDKVLRKEINYFTPTIYKGSYKVSQILETGITQVGSFESLSNARKFVNTNGKGSYILHVESQDPTQEVRMMKELFNAGKFSIRDKDDFIKRAENLGISEDIISTLTKNFFQVDGRKVKIGRSKTEVRFLENTGKKLAGDNNFYVMSDTGKVLKTFKNEQEGLRYVKNIEKQLGRTLILHKAPQGIASTLSEVDATARNLMELRDFLGTDLWRIQTNDEFMRVFGTELKQHGWVGKNWTDHIPDDLSGIPQGVIDQAKYIQNHISHIANMPAPWQFRVQRRFDYTSRDLLQSKSKVKQTLGAGLAKLKTTRDVTQYLKSGTAIALLGNVGSGLLQASGLLNTLLTQNPGNTLKGLQEVINLLQVREVLWRTGSNSLTEAGKALDFKYRVGYLDETNISGDFNLALEVDPRKAFNSVSSLGRSAASSFGKSLMFFVRKGEWFNRVLAYSVKLQEVEKEFPKLSLVAQSNIAVARAKKIGLDFSKSADPAFAQGISGLLFQFKKFFVKQAEFLFGKDSGLTAMQRTSALAGYATLFGLAGLPFVEDGLYFFDLIDGGIEGRTKKQFVNTVIEQMKGVGIELDKEEVKDFLSSGILPPGIGSRISIGTIVKPYIESGGDITKVIPVIGVLTAFGRAGKFSYNYAHGIISAQNWHEGINSALNGDLEDVEALASTAGVTANEFGNVYSFYRNLGKAFDALQQEQVVNQRTLKPIILDPTVDEIVSLAIGFSPERLYKAQKFTHEYYVADRVYRESVLLYSKSITIVENSSLLSEEAKKKIQALLLIDAKKKYPDMIIEYDIIMRNINNLTTIPEVDELIKGFRLGNIEGLSTSPSLFFKPNLTKGK